MVEVVDPKTKEVWSFHLDKRLKAFLDKKVRPKIEKKDQDYVMLVDGYEGSGKSTFAMQMGRFIDPTLSLDRICMTSADFKQAIINSSKGQCVIYDEAVTGMSSGESITKIGRLLKSMMMQMRQKNLFVIVVLPSVFELNSYTVLSRARFFFHVYESSGKRGYWVGYNRKDLRFIYIRGKKNRSYVKRSFFNGRFLGRYAIDENTYRKKKEDALFEVDVEEEDGRIAQRNKLLWLIKTEMGLSFTKMHELLKNYDFRITGPAIQMAIKKYTKEKPLIVKEN